MKKKLYVLMALIILLFAGISMFTVSKSAQPFADEHNDQQSSEDLSHSNATSLAKENHDPNGQPAKETQQNTKEDLTFLLVGVDDEESGAARTDTIMVANVQPKHGEVKLASIMRDSYVEIPGYQNNKINASFAYGGVELLKETVEQNFGIDIDYHATVNFDGFVDVVDTLAPDGLEVNIEERMYYQDHSGEVSIDFHPGTHHLNGEETLDYVRFRSNDKNDFGRVARQQEVLALLKDELFSVASITKTPQLIGAIHPNFETDVSTSKMLSLGKDILLNPVENINTLRIPVEDSFVDERYSHAGAVLELDMKENSQQLQNFLDGNLEENRQTASRSDSTKTE